MLDRTKAKENWQGKRVLLLGMARSGIAVAQLLCRFGAVPLLNDRKTEQELGEALAPLRELPCEWHLGEDAEALLPQCDVLLISPGVPIDSPIVLKAREMNIPVTGELEVASQLCEGTLVALTGTNGKTTTVSLLGEIYRAMGKIAYVAGNIGYPLSAAAMLSKPEDMLVAEVSSFQLETTDTFHPRVAAVLNYDDPACRAMAEGLRARVAWFSRTQEVPQGAFVREDKITIRWDGAEKAVCRTDEVYIPGPHNLENALAAAMMAYASGVPTAVIRHALRTFKGVEHRIELVRELDGVKWYNDSKGTNVDSTIKAVQTMRAPTVLVLGGSDKHVSFDALAREIIASGQIKCVVLCGATAPQIESALFAAGYTAIEHAEKYPEMVALCRRLAAPGGNVLLSPACASFDQFSDYEQRGRIFKQLVNELQ